MIVAFDFDKCLDDERMQRLAKKFIKERNEVWVVTMRRENEFNCNILKPVLENIKLSKYNVIYCNGKTKFEMLEGINADLYIDNIDEEFEVINSQTQTIPLLWIG